MIEGEARATKSVYAGLFLIALATLAFEIVLTRIFSVTVWYHFAFLAVSLAMFGMTTGALLIHLFPQFFPENDTNKQLTISAVLFALTAPLAMLMHLSMPVILDPVFMMSAVGWFAVFANCLALSLPFTFSGICVCLILTRFKYQVASLYAADLLGAALACLLVAAQIGASDGPTTLLLAATLGGLAAVLFSGNGQQGKWRGLSLLTFCILGLMTSANFSAFRMGEQTPFRIMWIKGAVAAKPAYERWNSFSAIRVIGDPHHPQAPTGWGLHPRFIRGNVTGQIYLDIDGNAGTYLTGFRGNLAEVDYLKYDVTNIAHYLVEGANVLVVGVGGGRDILSALVFHQKSVLGVELNHHILYALTEYFGNFTGHLDKQAGVSLVNDEARSYITRSKQKFDLIEVSLIDTYAATAAGAFALAENSIYTLEAWQTFLDHLTERGMVSVSRWFEGSHPAEIYRAVSLATAALQSNGVKDPRMHLALIRFENPGNPGIGTLLVSKEPLKEAQLAKLDEQAKAIGFQIYLSPTVSVDPKLALIADAKKPLEEIEAAFDTQITPPSDDRPYFFEMAKIPSLNSSDFWQKLMQESEYMQGLSILGVLMCVLSVLLVLCIYIPLKVSVAKVDLKKSAELCIYFMSIGLGFMFIEISQMQRLSVFLGNPTYSLSVVLSAMLAFSGLGSLLISFLDKKQVLSSPVARMVLVTVVVLLVGLITPVLTKQFLLASTAERIMLAIALLAPLGLVAGMGFPTGMKMAEGHSRSLLAWLWGINGAASVLASVLAVFCSINVGISATYYLSCVFYVIAAIAAHLNSRKKVQIEKEQVEPTP